jgi:Ferritin-like domain
MNPDTTETNAGLVSRRRAFQLAGAAALSTAALATALSSTASAEIEMPSIPTELDEADRDLLGYAVTLEMACVALYSSLMTSGGLSSEAGAVAATLRDHHEIHGRACAALAGNSNPYTANATMVDEYAAGFAGGDLASAWEVEERMVASHLALLGLVKGAKGSESLGSIINADAAHAVVMATLSGNEPLVEVERVAGVFDPAKYAVVK